jgi:Pyridoxamine 5'-phosphate oxidase
MSIPVDVTRLAEALADFGAGYLLTASAGGRVKAVTVEPTVEEGALVVAAAGRGSAANLAENPAVTLVFPPAEPRGFTLIVDGSATATETMVRVVPEGAVLHRPAAHSDGPPAPDGCGQDCHPV